MIHSLVSLIQIFIILWEQHMCMTTLFTTVFSCETLFQEVFKIPKLTVEERKRTERELGKISH